MTKSEILMPGHRSAMLFRPELSGKVEASWFCAESWGQGAIAVDSGGRGSAWFIKADGLSMVLRHYLRGGYVARVSREAYLFLGAGKTRSFTEFRLLNQLHGMGLPVPKPLAARYERIGGIAYRASILIERIADVTPLGGCFNQLDCADWVRLGQLIRHFHNVGVYHADLNCFNILVRGTEFFMIDFDKGKLLPEAPEKARWKLQSLDRLHRSLSKVVKDDSVLDDRWNALKEGYEK